MERIRQPLRNVTHKLLTEGNGEPEDTERREEIVVERILDRSNDSGKKFQRVEYTDGEGNTKYANVFNPHLIEGLTPGDAVGFVFKKGKSNWWNLKEVVRPEKGTPPKDEFDTFFDAPAEKPKPEGVQPALIPAEPKREPQDIREALQSDKEKGMRSMNALTNATSLLGTLITKDIVKPTDLKDAMAMLVSMHTEMIAMHDPKPKR